MPGGLSVLQGPPGVCSCAGLEVQVTGEDTGIVEPVGVGLGVEVVMLRVCLHAGQWDSWKAP